MQLSEALGKVGCLDGQSVMRKPPAKPRHKVPAPQANEVTARLRPPPEARAGGGSGYDQPSPSIPLPVEGRGKPVATWPGILGALAASVTDLQTVTCIMGFLRVSANHWDNDAWRRLAGWMPVIARPHSGFAGEVSKRKMCYFWGFL